MYWFLMPVLLASKVTDQVSGCSKNKDCQTCTDDTSWNGQPCNWCPISGSCHSKWSPRNHCLSKQNILKTSHCLKAQPIRQPYDPAEAYKLAMFSALAYSDEPHKCLKAIFPTKDYKVELIYRRNCDDFWFDYSKKCFLFIVTSAQKKEIIVSYRGTRGMWQVLDQTLTIIGKPKVPTDIGGKVQQYFENIKIKLYDATRKIVSDILKKYPDYSVKITGHSLGGAAGSISSALLVKHGEVTPDKISLYTFGMPRVGNKQYAEAHNRLVPNSWRVVRDGDPIPGLPKCVPPFCNYRNGPYHHQKKVLYSGRNMTVDSPFKTCTGNDEPNSKCRYNKWRPNLFSLANYHKNYFGIPIGTYCRDYVMKNKTYTGE